ncbi:MAG: AbrB family transcriptional regulator, partial [Pseudomonadota bacterium]
MTPTAGTFLAGLPQIILSLILGTIGGAIFWWWGVPLAWMLGALTATSIASMIGVQTGVPKVLRSPMFIVIGVLIGSSFNEELLSQIGEWTLSLIGLLVCLVVSVAVGLVYLRLIARFDSVTAYFTSMPGGLSEMVAQGGSYGGDEADIVLAHSARVMLVVFAIPLGFQAVIGNVGAGVPMPDAGLTPLTATDVFWLCVSGLGGVVAGRLGLPAGMLLGALVASAIVHAIGLTHVSPPAPIVAAAQVVIGASLGARFAGRTVPTLIRIVAIAAGLTALFLLVAILTALAVASVTNLSVPALILAYAPGGVGEMSLIALALDADPALVSTHHL